jgi:hypothetical protein
VPPPAAIEAHHRYAGRRGRQILHRWSPLLVIRAAISGRDDALLLGPHPSREPTQRALHLLRPWQNWPRPPSTGSACSRAHRSPCGSATTELHHRPLGRQLAGPMVEVSFPAPIRALGQAGDARVDWAARVAKGAAIDVPRAKGSPFHPTHPGLVRCNDFKDTTKAGPLLPD